MRSWAWPLDDRTAIRPIASSPISLGLGFRPRSARHFPRPASVISQPFVAQSGTITSPSLSRLGPLESSPGKGQMRKRIRERLCKSVLTKSTIRQPMRHAGIEVDEWRYRDRADYIPILVCAVAMTTCLVGPACLVSGSRQRFERPRRSFPRASSTPFTSGSEGGPISRRKRTEKRHGPRGAALAGQCAPASDPKPASLSPRGRVACAGAAARPHATSLLCLFAEISWLTRTA